MQPGNVLQFPLFVAAGEFLAKFIDLLQEFEDDGHAVDVDAEIVAKPLDLAEEVQGGVVKPPRAFIPVVDRIEQAEMDVFGNQGGMHTGQAGERFQIIMRFMSRNLYVQPYDAYLFRA